MRKLISIILILVMIFSLCGCTLSNKELGYKLSDEEKIAYAALESASYYFANPQSVRILSGTMTQEYDVEDEAYNYFLDCRISSRNYFGASVASTYRIRYYGDRYEVELVDVELGWEDMKELRQEEIDNVNKYQTAEKYIAQLQKITDSYADLYDELFADTFVNAYIVDEMLNYAELNRLLIKKWDTLNAAN